MRALTLPLLFERARTGARTFYHHFKDRDDLVDAVFEYCYDTAVADLANRDVPEACARERFDILCKNIFDSYLTHPRELNFLYVYVFSYVEPDVDLCRVIPSIMLLTGIFTQAQETGAFASRVDPAVAARIVRSMIAGAFSGVTSTACAIWARRRRCVSPTARGSRSKRSSRRIRRLAARGSPPRFSSNLRKISCAPRLRRCGRFSPRRGPFPV